MDKFCICIEFDERATQMDDTTMHYGDEEESCQ